MTKHALSALGLAVGVAAVLVPSKGETQTISAQRIAAAQRLLPLKKITVGPDDQYDATLSADRRFSVFTQKADLVAHLQIQDLTTGDVVNLLPLNADSQESAFGPDGQLVFTFFKSNARGDVCYAALPKEPRLLKDEEIRCLPRSAQATRSRRSDPFWRSANEIGFIERDVTDQTAKIVIENLETGKQEVVVSGRIWSPSMRPGGRYLVYNELVAENGELIRRMVLHDLQSKRARVVHFELPGISGFPALSEDEQFMYFSHFLNDTNDDRAIDGGDNAVIFRVPISKIISTTDGVSVLPEQLTSVETSCSFPQPAGESVFATCAFEGSLDIYQLPSSGIVPHQWNVARILNAHQTARSYQDRILLLSALRYRTGDTSRVLDEKLLSDHLYSDDTVAARYYLSRLAASASEKTKRFHSILGLYLEARELKKAQPPGELSREFQRKILEIDTEVARIDGEPRFRSIVRGLLRGFLEDTRATERFFKQVRFDSSVRPLERYFYFELAQGLYQRSSEKGFAFLREAYRQLMTAGELNEESRLYYAFSFLKQTAELEASPVKRMALIEEMNKGLPLAATALLKSEAVVLKLIEAADDKAKATVYRDLDQLMSQSRNDYFLRKALYVRAILNFAAAAEFKYLTLVATNWLRYTAADDTEFSYAREVFASSALEQAYENLGKGKLDFAGNFFYESVSLTDDLESHAGYILTMSRKGQRAIIDERYKNLRDRNFVADNMKFVEALLALVDAKGKADSGTQALDQAIEKLQAMTQDRDSAVRYLLLGYCQLEKMMRLSNGLEFDAELFQAAHRSLMLAYDLGRDNQRIKASALMNLGILHQRVQNFGLSSRFFALRKPLGFLDEAERARFEWLYAKSLGHSNQMGQAAAELASIAEPSRETPHLERQAFYLALDGKYKEAVVTYERVMKGGGVSGDLNLAKIKLTYGYASLKAGEVERAKTLLSESLQHAGRLSVIKRDADRAADFRPTRIEMIVLGLLGQIGTPEERLMALEKRGELLAKNRDSTDSWLPAMIQNRQQLAGFLTKTNGPRAAQLMRESLQLTEEYGETNQYVGHAVFQSLANSIAHGILNPILYAKQDEEKLGLVYGKWMQAFKRQKAQAPMMDYMAMKLRVLWAGYAKEDLESVMKSDQAQKLKAEQPERWPEIESLVSALMR